MQYDEKCRMCRDDRLEPVRLATCPRQEPQLHEIGLETLAGFRRWLPTQVIAQEAIKIVRWDEHPFFERVQGLRHTRAHDRLCGQVEIPQDVRCNALVVVGSPDIAHQAPNPVGKEPLQNRLNVTGSSLQAVLAQVRYQLALQSLKRVEMDREPCSEQTFCKEQILECPLTIFGLCRLPCFWFPKDSNHRLRH